MSIANNVSITGTGKWYPSIYQATIDFNGTGAQVIPLYDYYNLTLSGARTGSNNITLPSSGVIGILGTFTASATFSTGNYITTGSTIAFKGIGGAQRLGSAFVFNNITLNNNAGLTLGADATVRGTLDFTSGMITTGINKLVVGSSSPSCTSGTITGASASSYVIGNVRRYVPNGSSPSVQYPIGDATGYAPIRVDFVGTTSGCGYLDASTVVSQPVLASGISQTKYINRKWTLTNGGVMGFSSYSPTFNYVVSDEVGSPNSGSLVVKQYDGTTWLNTSTGIELAESTQATGVTSFSDFYIGEQSSLVVSTQPVGASICTGSNATFSSSSTSLPTPTIQWQRSVDGTSWVNITSGLDAGTVYSGFATETLSVTGSVVGMNAYQYRAVFSNINGSVESNAAQLTVSETSVSSVGTVAAVAFNSASQSTTLNYTNTTGNSISYSIDWNAAANSAGLSDQAITLYTFIAGAGTVTGIVIPANVPVGNYNAVMPITNSTGCSTTLNISVAVNLATPVVSVTVGNYTYNSNAQGPVAATNTGTGNSYTYSYIGTGATNYGPSATRPTNAGSYSVTATVAANGNYTIGVSNATAFTITKANAVINVIGYTVYHDGIAHIATFTAVGVETTPVNLSSLMDVSGTTHTNVGSYTDTWIFAGNLNYNATSSSVNDVINVKATPVVTVTVGTYRYNGTTQGPNAAINTGTGSTYTYSYSGTGSTTYATSANRPINAGTYTVIATVAANGSYSTGNSTAIAFTITKANAVINVIGYTVYHDGIAHIATFTAVGVEITPVNLSSLMDVSGTTHTNVGSYTDTWIFAGNLNYNATSSSVNDVINVKATPVVTVTVGTYTYNGTTQGPNTATNTGSGSSYTYSYSGTGSTSYGPSAAAPTNAGTYTAIAAVAANGSFAAGSSIATAFTITKANAVINVIGYTVTYDDNAHTATFTAVGVETTPVNLSSLMNVNGTTHTLAGTYNDSWSFAGNTNYNATSGSIANVINKANPLISNWPNASDIKLGQSLVSSILSGGVSSVNGNFQFTDTSIKPSAIGNYNATVIFRPTDTVNFNSIVNTAVVVKVLSNRVAQKIFWTGNVSTDWANASNWNLFLVPISFDSVIVPLTTKKPIITTDQIVTSVAIDSGATISVTSGGLTVNSNIIVAPGASILGNYDLIHSNAIVQQNGIAQRGYRVFANPFTTGQTLKDVAANNGITINTTAQANGLTDARLYDYVGNEWTNASNTIGANIAYALFVRGLANEVNDQTYSKGPSPFIYKVSGTLNGRLVGISASLSTPNFTIAANPFIAPINTSGLTNGSGKPYYIYQISREGDGRKNAGSWIAQLSSSVNTTIPVLGAIVYQPVSSSTYSVQSLSDINLLGDIQTGFGSSDPNISSLELQIEKSGIYQDRLFIRLDNSATDNGIDRIDLQKFYNDSINLYSKSTDNKNMAVDARSKLTAIPLGITGKPGLYNFRLVSNNLPIGTKVILNDKLINMRNELKVGDTYYYNISADSTSLGENRFELDFNDNIVSLPNMDSLTNIIIYPNPATDYFKFKLPNTNIKYHIYLTDLIGQNARELTAQGGSMVQIPVKNLTDGYYIITISDGFNSISKRVLKGR